MGHVAASFSQAGYRWRNDDGNETTATYPAALNTPITLVPATVKRCRVILDETAGGAENNVSTQWQYRLNGGTWTNVTTTSAVARAVTSTQGTLDATQTTQQISAGAFVPAEITEDGLSDNIRPSFVGNENSELELVFQLVSGDVANGDTVELRIVRADLTVFTTYAQIPSLTADVSTGPQEESGGSTATIVVTSEGTGTVDDGAGSSFQDVVLAHSPLAFFNAEDGRTDLSGNVNSLVDIGSVGVLFRATGGPGDALPAYWTTQGSIGALESTNIAAIRSGITSAFTIIMVARNTSTAEGQYAQWWSMGNGDGLQLRQTVSDEGDLRFDINDSTIAGEVFHQTGPGAVTVPPSAEWTWIVTRAGAGDGMDVLTIDADGVLTSRGGQAWGAGNEVSWFGTETLTIGVQRDEQLGALARWRAQDVAAYIVIPTRLTDVQIQDIYDARNDTGGATGDQSGGSTALISVISEGSGTGEESASGSSTALVTVTSEGTGTPLETVSGGSTAIVTVTSEGSGQASASQTGGSTALVSVTSEGSGTATESASGGSTALVSVISEGSGTGTEEASGGATTLVTVTATGTGQAGESQTGGSTAIIVVTSEGSGTAVEDADDKSGGSTSSVLVTSEGSGQGEENVSGGSTATLTVSPAGSGVATENVESGSTALITVSSEGSGTGEEETSGGSTALITVLATGGGTSEGDEVGGSTALISVSAEGAGSGVESGRGGATSTVLVTAEGSGAGEENASGGSTAIVTVSPAGEGSGEETAEGGSTAIITVSAEGAGTSGDDLVGGSTATVTVTSEGSGTPEESGEGGSTATLTVTATGAGAILDTVADGSTAAVSVLSTGEGTAVILAAGGSVAFVTVRAFGGGGSFVRVPPDSRTIRVPARDSTITVGPSSRTIVVPSKNDRVEVS